MLAFRSIAAAAVLLFAVGCGSDDPTGPGPGALEVVTGRVLEVDDQTPVDGGVTIELVLEGDGEDRLLFPSLFTYPPPGDDVLRLYDLVRRVEVGDRVRARGTRSETGLRLEELWILEGSLDPTGTNR